MTTFICGQFSTCIFALEKRCWESSLKAGRDRLACLALQEIFGVENMDILFGGEEIESESDESDGLSGSAKVRLCVIVIARVSTHCLLKRLVVVTAARFCSSRCRILSRWFIMEFGNISTRMLCKLWLRLWQACFRCAVRGVWSSLLCLFLSLIFVLKLSIPSFIAGRIFSGN